MIKKLFIILMIITVLGGCATMGSNANDNDYTQKNLQVVDKTIQQNIWDLVKIGVSALGQAILLNNYLIHP